MRVEQIAGVCVILLVVALSCAPRERVMKTDLSAAIVDVGVGDNGECTADPYEVTIGVGDKVVWLASQSPRPLRWTFQQKSGVDGLIGPVDPIPPQASATASKKAARAGEWEYNVIATHQDQVECELDPLVIIKE